ncbi:MAG: DUF4832 domain-containing protein [Saprospiraceae bacterium]
MSNYLVFIGMICICICSELTAQTTVTYQPSTSDFANPERGFYRYSEARSSNYILLDQTTLENYRLLHTPPTASYSIYSTLVFRYFFLEDFKASNISQTYLDNIQADFNTARLAGVKIIPRFAYTDEVDGSGCASFICPPYGDAAKNWILTHINQLQPILETNKDVIAAVQMGLIGVWGENYYTDHFGDASQGPFFQLLDENWTDRIEVLNALVSAVPTERMVQVRYPQQKQRAIYGVNAATDVDALTLGEAFQGTNKARLGFHNDCLLASADDFGTFTDYGNSSSNSTSDTLNLKPYFTEDSKFVVVGGETCSDGYSPENDCASTNTAAYGDTELERLHYSYLNSQYNNDVNNDWEGSGCMTEIKQRLGYRFELQDGQYSNSAQSGQVIELTINLKNVGYASPYNERGLELILRNTATGDLWFASLTDDPRFWFADNSIHNIMETICIPNGMAVGDYEALLNLPDPMPSLYANPAYAIRLANLLPDNSDPWESATGYNKLGHTITIDNTSTNSNCNGETTFTELSAILPVELLDFRANARNENIILDWTTASETNNKGFHVERSLNSKDFKSIAWVEGKGTINGTTHYSILDSDVLKNTNYYYRLAQIDLEGTVSYSELVTARINTDNQEIAFANSIKIYPNPTYNKLRMDWNNKLENIVSIDLLNVFGQQVSLVNHANKIIDLTAFPEGIYFLRFNTLTKAYLKKVTKL